MSPGSMRRGMRTLSLVAVFAVSPLAAQVPQSSPIATGTLVVRGRCVDFDTGAPLSRCRVQLTGHQCTGYPLAWSLYGRILKLDIAKLEERYRGVDKKDERQRFMAMDGIAPNNA